MPHQSLPSISTVLASLLALVALQQAASAADQGRSPDKCLVFVGAYTQNEGQGVYVCDFDLQRGELGPPRAAAAVADTNISNPSFLAVAPQGDFLYAVSEVADYADQNTGAVAAFAVDPASGALTLLNHQPSAGAGPCYVALDASGKAALVANYGGGSVASLPIQRDGKLAPPASSFQHQGSSVNTQRQEGPHAHSINVDRQNRFALACDLGTDQVVSYRFDAASGKLEPNPAGTTKMPPGSGPRHLAFHPNGHWAYVNGELDSTVMACAYDAQRGGLAQLGVVRTLPADYDGSQNTTAEVQIHPNGKYLYVSNRGHDSIAMFAIDATSGKLTPLGHQPTGGKTPRNFGVDPSGRWLLAANQDSGTVTVHRIDPATGKLAATDNRADIPAPACVKFLAHSPGK
ncbi:MAG: lactonase family protein [Pirellulales bacterium]|nr:lactonase family protein [Pirellulales bacterium]